jgi:hypothetical protein
MISSVRVGRCRAPARSRVQVGAAGETQAGTVLPAEQQTGGRREYQLFTDHVPDVDVRRPLKQRVKIRIVGRLGIGAEHRGIDIDVYVGTNFAQAAPAVTLHRCVDAAPPEIFAGPSGLQLPGDGNRRGEFQIQSVEGRIVRPKLSNGLHRALLEIPEVYSQHSRLT